MQTITVDVTAEDIKQGQHPPTGSHRTESCAIAVALRRLFPTAKQVSWGYTKGNADTQEIDAIDANRTSDFVRRHDRGYCVKPFTFDAIINDLQVHALHAADAQKSWAQWRTEAQSEVYET